MPSMTGDPLACTPILPADHPQNPPMRAVPFAFSSDYSSVLNLDASNTLALHNK